MFWDADSLPQRQIPPAPPGFKFDYATDYDWTFTCKTCGWWTRRKEPHICPACGNALAMDRRIGRIVVYEEQWGFWRQFFATFFWDVPKSHRKLQWADEPEHPVNVL